MDEVPRAARHALWIGLLPAAWVFLGSRRHVIGLDSAHAYWHAWQQDLYGPSPGSFDAYSYAPVFAQVIHPLAGVPWSVFLVVWSLLLAAALAWLLWPLPGAWRWLALGYALPPAVAIGNIEPLVAVAVVVGSTRPGAWAFPLLTKITPALGVVWFAVRREWGRLAAVALWTAAIVGASAAADPDAWVRWVRYLVESEETTQVRDLPLWVRLPLAAGLVAWGAARDRRWLLAVGMVVAMPLWSSGVLLLLAAVPRLLTTSLGPTSSGAGSPGSVEAGSADFEMTGRLR
ncbi:glycosyltransferase 87 family protein [Phycicoccus sonneratiae]|uniref:DUF2029 domain-containing protein n=1 Tax=Phycicoccus sonneratiae TaxID=2807628 RepID=A0ABS2CM73_9MICO|nr:glycosyltransferase 87 family protein [Phycicoccus sonneraticus]MBM6400943.1 DUF2029 domain-containing protein [Phycicoccus sonneraticus]